MVAAGAPAPVFGSEIVIGLVAPIGTDLDAPQATLTDQLRAFGYDVQPLRLSALAEVEARKLGVELKDSPECERIRTHMKAGNRLREHFERDDWLALHALAVINNAREERPEAQKPPGKTAYIVRSLKHPREVETLRQTYGSGFFLVAVYSSERERFEYLTKTKGCTEDEARALIRIDMEEEDDPHGQRTRRTFALADVFIDRDAPNFDQKLRRVDREVGQQRRPSSRSDAALGLPGEGEGGRGLLSGDQRARTRASCSDS